MLLFRTERRIQSKIHIPVMCQGYIFSVEAKNKNKNKINTEFSFTADLKYRLCMGIWDSPHSRCVFSSFTVCIYSSEFGPDHVFITGIWHFIPLRLTLPWLTIPAGHTHTKCFITPMNYLTVQPITSLHNAYGGTVYAPDNLCLFEFGSFALCLPRLQTAFPLMSKSTLWD